MTLVSVLIANYNGAEVLARCVTSVLNQALPKGTEIETLVHDDASDDGSHLIAAQLLGEDKVLRSSTNLGFCQSNNRLASSARGDYLLFLNNDAWLPPDALAVLLAQAQPDHVLGLEQRDYAGKSIVDRGADLDLFLNAVPRMKLGPVGFVMGACLWIERERFFALGGFPPFLGSMAEDIYLAVANRTCGGAVRIVGDSFFAHRVGHSFGGGSSPTSGRWKTSYRRRYLSERNRLLVAVATYPSPLLLLLPVWVSLLMAEALVLAAAGSDGRNALRRVYLPALRDAARLLPVAWRARVHLRPMRQIGLLAFSRTLRWRSQKLVNVLRHGLPVFE